MGTSIGEADERSGGVGGGLFEGAENWMSGGRGEEDHVEGHQVWFAPSPSEFRVCEG